MLKARETTHRYTAWRDQLDSRRRAQLARLEQRTAASEAPVLTEDQILVVVLAQLLDAGGETTEYIRDLYENE